jgi:hypothetical protein
VEGNDRKGRLKKQERKIIKKQKGRRIEGKIKKSEHRNEKEIE